jgi:hypothetical protein
MVVRVRKGNCIRWISVVLALGTAAPVAAQSISYVSIARTYLAASTVASITVRGQDKPPKSLRLTDSATARLVITADTQAVFKTPTVLPARFTYLWTGAPNEKGKTPNFKKQNLLLFLSAFSPPANDKAAARLTVQIGPQDQQLRSSPEALAMVRLIGQQAAAADISALELTGSMQASTTEADAPYVRFSQFLFPTLNGEMIAVTLRTMTDGNADAVQSDSDVMGSGAPVVRNTLLWYHLVCGMPATVDRALENNMDSSERATLAQDYAKLKALLGPCT